MNLSQLRRQKMLSFLKTIKNEHSDDDKWIATVNEIENELNEKKYGLVWEEHEEAVDVKMRTHIPVFTEVKKREITIQMSRERERESITFYLKVITFTHSSCLKKHTKAA